MIIDNNFFRCTCTSQQWPNQPINQSINQTISRIVHALSSSLDKRLLMQNGCALKELVVVFLVARMLIQDEQIPSKLGDHKSQVKLPQNSHFEEILFCQYFRERRFCLARIGNLCRTFFRDFRFGDVNWLLISRSYWLYKACSELFKHRARLEVELAKNGVSPQKISQYVCTKCTHLLCLANSWRLF